MSYLGSPAQPKTTSGWKFSGKPVKPTGAPPVGRPVVALNVCIAAGLEGQPVNCVSLPGTEYRMFEPVRYRLVRKGGLKRPFDVIANCSRLYPMPKPPRRTSLLLRRGVHAKPSCGPHPRARNPGRDPIDPSRFSALRARLQRALAENEVALNGEISEEQECFD